ncbi:MAG TPA: sulfotransferase [Thermoanaerobaculia bacterium]
MLLLHRLRARRQAPMPFIVGAPRSGTTMLRLMLDAHPELAIPPETGFLQIVPELRGWGDALRERFFQAVTTFPANAPAWEDFQIPAEEFRARLAGIRPFHAADGVRLFYRMYAARFGKPRWGDKTPLYSRHLLDIRKLLPEARFIHLVRDGRDVAVSLRERWFSPGRDIAVQAAFWRDHVAAARDQGRACPHFLEVRFEDLVRDPETMLGRICDFAGLELRPEMLFYPQRAARRLEEHGARHTADGEVLVSLEERLRQQAHTHRPPDPAKIGVWRRELSAEEARIFEEIAGGLLAAYSYHLDVKKELRRALP